MTVFRLYDIMHSKTTAGKIGYLRQIKKPNPEHHVRTYSARSEVLTKNIRYKREPRAIQKMGAQGIVEIDNQLKIIFGEEAKQVKKNIDDLK